MVIAEKLSCARSSFYWYFKNRAELLDALLDHWQAVNAKSVISKSRAPATSINHALINVFACWVDESLFDTRLDFAIREWARRSGTVRRAMDISDSYILDALSQMFERFNFGKEEAEVRARIVYYTQIGYNTMAPQDSMAERVKRGPTYVYSMTGQPLTAEEINIMARPEG
jgi:AcrR family transcriptional regulator